MKNTNQDTILQQLESKVEAQLQEAIRVFQNLDESTLLRPSDSGGWSIAQCLEHLNSYGRYYLPLIQDRIGQVKQDPEEKKFKSSWLGSYFVRIMDPATSTKKYNAFKDHIPSAQLDAYAVVAEHLRQQELLLRHLYVARAVDLNALKIPVSISRWIRLSLGEVLQFVVAHNERHLVQAKRNLK